MNKQLSIQFDVVEEDRSVRTEATKPSPTVEEKKEVKKLYYSIGEVARELKVSPSLIRYWESEFVALKPKKNARGVRKFTEKDIALLHEIYQLVKEKGFTIQGAKDALKKGKDDQQRNLQMIEQLKQVRSFLVKLNDNL